MALTIKTLACVALTTTDTPYVTPANSAKAIVVKNIVLCNSGVTTRTVNVTLYDGSSATAHLSGKDSSLTAGQREVLDAEIAIPFPFALKAVASGTGVTMVVNGVERDL